MWRSRACVSYAITGQRDEEPFGNCSGGGTTIACSAGRVAFPPAHTRVLEALRALLGTLTTVSRDQVRLPCKQPFFLLDQRLRLVLDGDSIPLLHTACLNGVESKSLERRRATPCFPTLLSLFPHASLPLVLTKVVTACTAVIKNGFYTATYGRSGSPPSCIFHSAPKSLRARPPTSHPRPTVPYLSASGPARGIYVPRRKKDKRRRQSRNQYSEGSDAVLAIHLGELSPRDGSSSRGCR
jgi:hypothetical protein